MFKIEITKTARKELKKAPVEIVDSFEMWVNNVEKMGPHGLLLINGYRDHALQGEWDGARASYLNKQWRVVYWVAGDSITVTVVRGSAHDYRR